MNSNEKKLKPENTSESTRQPMYEVIDGEVVHFDYPLPKLNIPKDKAPEGACDNDIEF